MRRKWIWLLVGWLMILGVVGCGQTVTVEPASAIETEPSLPGTAPSEKATPSVLGTPAPLGAVAPISPTQVIQEETVTISPTIPSPSNPALQRLVMQAKEDLAQRLFIEVSQIGLVDANAVEWPDASLGCPEPEMVYAQVITPGFRVVLEVEGQMYEYHADESQAVVLCEMVSSSGSPRGGDATVQDGWPSQPLDDDVIIAPPLERK